MRDTFIGHPTAPGYTVHMVNVDDDRDVTASVFLFRGDDGAVSVQIDTSEDTGPVRVTINDGVIFDADPEDPTTGREA